MGLYIYSAYIILGDLYLQVSLLGKEKLLGLEELKRAASSAEDEGLGDDADVGETDTGDRRERAVEEKDMELSPSVATQSCLEGAWQQTSRGAATRC